MSLRLLTIGHSYCVSQTRRLAHEMAVAGGARWDVTAVAPRRFPGDLRPIVAERLPGERNRLETVDVCLARRPHVMLYGRRTQRLLREHGGDLIHVWEEPYVAAGAQLAWWAPPSARVVFATFQNINKRYPPPFAQFERYAMRRANGWIAFGFEVERALCGRPAYRDRPVRVIHPGVDTAAFTPDSGARAAVRRQLGWEVNGPPVVGFIGRFIPAKGLSTLTQALEPLLGRVRALFVGGGPLEAELRAWAEGREDVRVVTGIPHDAVPAYLNALDIFCLPSCSTPSWREQFGRVLIEAFACGLTVLGSDSGEIPHVIADAGSILPEADAAAWLAEIARLADSPAERAELGRRGRTRACEAFAWPAVARRHLEFFSEIVEATPSGQWKRHEP